MSFLLDIISRSFRRFYYFGMAYAMRAGAARRRKVPH